jgi:hypothetical protein
MAFNPSSSLTTLLDAPVRPGRLVWIGLRLERRGPVEGVCSAELEAGLGLVGDRYSRRDGPRQVTMIGTENLAAIASYLGGVPLAPDLVRRN